MNTNELTAITKTSFLLFLLLLHL